MADMTPAISWIMLLMMLVCLGSQFWAWWKLRKLKSFLDQTPEESKVRMPVVKFFGSYRKGLIWARENLTNLPANQQALAKHALFFDRLAIVTAGILVITFVAGNIISS